MLPRVTPETEFFWTSGADGRLRFLCCTTCGLMVHPPGPVCPTCRTRTLEPRPVSGRATVVSYTVNHQPWIPGFDPPYVVALVEIDEQPSVRLMTNLVGCSPEEVRIGVPVQVCFEHRDDVWLPLFEPAPEDGPMAPSSGAASAGDRPRMATRARGERAAVISGAGQSEVGRRLYRGALDLTVDACLAAITDAGLLPGDIDGVATYPGAMDTPPGFSGVGVAEVQDALRLELDWYNGGLENPGQLGSVVTACAAVAAGYARHVLCFRTVTEASAQGTGGRASVTPGGVRIGGFMQWSLPFGAASAANWIALYAQRYMHVYGLTREQLAQVALTGRRHAALNPKAVYRDPMTLDDYLAARPISTPLGLYDCDAPCDGSTAVVVSAAEVAPDLRRPPIRLQAIGSALRGRNSWDQWEDLTTMACRDAAAMLWDRTELRPGDVDLVELYDGFSFITAAWLEALGFCGKGEVGPFLEDGDRLFRDGALPLNTNGGQLSGGRLHGFGLLHEACVQLWGEGGDRQVPGGPEVALAAAGGGNLASCVLLAR
ncbi:MAG: thiolase C-terminal domain-containing protein [Acidimicrobiales bacterium]